RLHVLRSLFFPRAYKPAMCFYLPATTRATARRARRVLTISEYARRDIVRLLNVPEECIDVTYPAVEERYRRLPEDEVEAFRLARGLPEAFVFTLGTLEPPKNLVVL